MITVRTAWTTRTYPTATHTIVHGDVVDIYGSNGDSVATITKATAAIIEFHAPRPGLLDRLRHLWFVPLVGFLDIFWWIR